MTNEITPTANPPSRLMVLTHSELFSSALRQHLHGSVNCRLSRNSVLRAGHLDAELILIDLGSYTHDECLQLLKLVGETPTALVNAPPEPARRLFELHPWIRGVFYPATDCSNFVKGIATLLAGNDWLPRSMMEKLLVRYRQLTHDSQVINDLTLREKQILTLAGKGLSNSAIATRLHLSTHTIKSHVHNALGKLGASNRAQGASLVMAHVREPEL